VKKRIISAVMTAMLVALILAITALATTFNYTDFSSTAGLTLVESASQAGTRLRLVPALTSQRGAAWTASKQSVQFGFDTTFTFQITNQYSGGADGLAFVIQNNAANAIGDYGGGMGYHNMPNSLAVEFDTWYNGGLDEPNNNHISVRSQGTAPNSAIGTSSLGTVAAGLPIFSADGAIHTAQIVYSPGTMDVYLDGLLRLSVSVDLATLLSLDNGTAYVGFTAATGAAAENEDILSWSFSGNNPPTADAGGPYMVGVGGSIAFDGSGSSDPDGDALTETWTADGGAVAGNVYTAGSEAGIFNVCLTVNDGTVDSAEVCTIVVVYDPSAGFVTGGGWIDSPAGAYKDDETLSGKATFGFVSKYKKGANVPTGNTQFQFHTAGFNFHSDTYEWLVVNQGGASAQFKGEGTVNGELDSNGNAYKFMIWAGDGSPDTFRIRIWSELGGVETVVYDNGFDQELGGGSIVIHTK